MKPEEVVKPENLQNAQQYVDFVKNNLQPLADHLKVSVEWLWQILVQQARVEAIVYLIIVIVLSVKSIILLTIAYKNWKKARFGSSYAREQTIYIHKKTGKEVDWDTWWDKKSQYDVVKTNNSTNREGHIAIWAGVSGGLLSLATVVTLTTALPIIVTGLVNPEFRAIEKIVEYAKPAANNVQSK